MNKFAKTLLASSVLLASASASAGLVQVDFDGNGISVAFDELDLGRFQADSYYVDVDGDGTIENGEIVFDNANNIVIDRYDFGISTEDFVGGALELNYIVAGFATIDDNTGLLLDPNFSVGIFNLFTLDTNGDRTGLAASFSMDSYLLDINNGQGPINGNISDAEIEFRGVAVEAGSENSLGGFFNIGGVSFQDLIAAGNPPSFRAELDFETPTDAITNVNDLNATGQVVSDIWGPEVNNNTTACNFGGCSTFIFQDNQFSTGSDSLWEAIRGTFRDGFENDDVYTRSTVLDADEILINVSAPGTLGMLGATLLALGGLRRRRSA
jgi:hypothetical protein